MKLKSNSCDFVVFIVVCNSNAATTKEVKKKAKMPFLLLLWRDVHRYDLLIAHNHEVTHYVVGKSCVFGIHFPWKFNSLNFFHISISYFFCFHCVSFIPKAKKRRKNTPRPKTHSSWGKRAHKMWRHCNCISILKLDKPDGNKWKKKIQWNSAFD